QAAFAKPHAAFLARASGSDSFRPFRCRTNILRPSFVAFARVSHWAIRHLALWPFLRMLPTNRPFKLVSPFKPMGDQPQAIDALVKRIGEGDRASVLLGATGTGKTFTMANVIERTQKPTLILSHNKTLAAQLYEEMKELFPNNAVSYFVSYYDYYQP